MVLPIHRADRQDGIVWASNVRRAERVAPSELAKVKLIYGSSRRPSEERLPSGCGSYRGQNNQGFDAARVNHIKMADFEEPLPPP
jgi:hypothetical protein